MDYLVRRVPNPLPTPEEPLRDSFESKDGEHLGHGIGNCGSEGKSLAVERHSPSPSIGTKRSHDEMEDVKTTASEATSITPVSASFPKDWELFSERATNPTDEASTPSSSTELPVRPGPTGKPKVGAIEAAFNRDPKKHLATCLNELDMFRQARRRAAEKAAEKENGKGKGQKRQKVTRSFSTRGEVAAQPSPSHDTVVVDTPVQAPAVTTRQSRARPAPIATKEATIAQAPLHTPPATVSRRATPNRKSMDSTKKAAARAAAKKQKATKTKPKSSINDKQDSIKGRLNKRYEDQGMNTAGGKGAHWLFDDAYIPKLNLDLVVEPPAHERTEIVQKEVKIDDPVYSRLHPKEVQVASWMRASASEYLTQKRRFFIGVAEWYRSGYPEVKRAHAQSFCNQDGNSTTYMHETFKRWGWFDREKFPDELLETIPRLFDAEGGNKNTTTPSPAITNLGDDVDD